MSLPFRQRCVRGTRETIPSTGHVQRSLLRRLENGVAVVPLVTDLCGHAVEALRAVLRARERRGAATARAVCPLSSSNGWTAADHRWASATRSTLPVRSSLSLAQAECGHLLFDSGAAGRFVMHLLFPQDRR